MPTKPSNVSFRATNWEIVNALSEHMPVDWNNRIPEATKENMAEIANPILNYEGYRNAFINALMNRIALVLITSKTFYNPLNMFKRGTLAYGETVEEIFVNIARAHQFDQEIAEKEVFKREIPDVQSAFHRLNAKNFYKVTISNEELRTAFLSDYGLSDLIGRIVESLYNGAQVDEFIQMKHIITDAYTKNMLYPVSVPALSEDTAKSIVRTIKGISNALLYPSTAYNPMGVVNHTPREDQVLLITAQADAYFDVDVLASAFNMSKVEFIGRRVVVDSLGNPDIIAALVDRDFFMVFNNFEGFTENYNGQGLYWNYFYHVWRTYSRSPFANAVVFTTANVSVTVDGTLTPDTINVDNGGSVQIQNTTTSTGGATTNVSYELTQEAKDANFTLNAQGVIGVPAGAPTNSSMPVVVLTSDFDGSQKTLTLNLVKN